MKRCMVLMVIAFGLFAFDGVSLAWVNPGKELRITRDTTFTKADSPIDPGGDIIVESGVTLTIEPGVTVYLCGPMYERYDLWVYGTLKAIGTEAERILFTSGGMGMAGAICITDSTSTTGTVLRYCDIKGYINIGIVLRGAAPEISHCFIDAEGPAIYVPSAKEKCISPIIRHNTIRTSTWPGILFGGELQPIIEYNKFWDKGAIDIVGRAKPVIRYNWLIAGIGYGGTEVIDVRYNWWGTTDEVEIREKIHTRDIEKIMYSPWLMAPPDISSVIPISWGELKSLFR